MIRAMVKTPAAVNTWFVEMAKTKGADARLDASIKQLQKELADVSDMEYRARSVIEQMALTMQASLLVQTGNNAVAEAFICVASGCQRRTQLW